MITKVIMPKLSDAMETGKVIKWLKKEGEAVKGGDVLVEVETDKANVEVEAFGSGVLRKILIAEGSQVPVGDLIGVIADPTDPHAPEGGILRLAEDQSVLDRHPRLVVVAVEHPLLELQTRQLAVVHQLVIAVVVVVSALAFATHPVDELLARQQRARRSVAHSRSSIPSHATSQPASATVACSRESSRSIGFVLLTWM